VFCCLCALFTNTKSTLTKGCKIDNYSKINAIISSHEKSIQHKNACESFLKAQGSKNKSTIIGSSLPPSRQNSNFNSRLNNTTTTTTITTTSVTTWMKTNMVSATTTFSTCALSTGHEHSFQHEKPCETSNQQHKCNSKGLAVTRPTPPSISYSNTDEGNKLELEPVEKNRKIVHDVICCVLMILSLGNF
jgi:hypothetical protein